MSNNQIANLLAMILGIMLFILLALVCVWVFLRFRSKQSKEKQTQDKPQENKKTKVQESYDIKSIFDFMEFDKIEDNMIIQKKGKKFLMMVKCQGINYDLMSGVEKTSVEQGFVQYLNTLRYPIQIYVQTKTVDLTGSLSTYKQRVKTLGDNLAQKEYEYNQMNRSGNYDKITLDKKKFEVTKARNLYEYGLDIVNNTEKMSLNKNILSKQYYIIIAYYPEEANNDMYSEDEVRNMAFSELYTRAQSTISLLSVCGISGKILDSTEIADVLYTAYNRDEAEVYDLKKALNAGYDNMYVTAPDVLDKRMRELDKQIELDAIQKANDAIYKVKNEQEKERQIRQREQEYDDIVARMAANLIEENLDILGDEVAEKAKDEVANDKKKKKVNSKEEGTNEQKKVKRAGRPRKTA